jgi:ribosome-associated protein
MRVNDISEIQKTISKINQKSLAYRQRLKQINQWQEQIISQGAMAINDFVDRYPNADRQKLSNLKRQINREVALKKTPSAKKKLFDYIKSLDD